MSYLNVDEIESAIETLALAWPHTLQRIALPNASHEGRSIHALRVGKSDAGSVDGVLVLGGVHAREWMPPDALISLAADLAEAYASNSGLGYGGASYTADEIQRLIENTNLFLLPCTNPDGRAHSQTVDSNWRKNRRPGSGGCAGVDINRNFDFLWDHLNKFAADSGVSASDDPCDYQVYRGPSAESEPETRNVVWLMDSYPRIRFMIDVHSAVPTILHSWGSDENQSSDPLQNFLNPAFDSVRGRDGDNAYREFIPSSEHDLVVELGNRLNDAVRAVRNIDYGVEQAFSLYPTSGASDDYAYCRHFADPSRTRVLGFTVECGSSFQPPWSEAEEVIREVSSGLIAFALAAPCAATPQDVNLSTPVVTFNDVPEGEIAARAVRFEVEGCDGATVQIVGAPSPGFEPLLGTSASVPAESGPYSRPLRLWLRYTGGAPGSTAAGTVRVRCVETGEEWDVALTANAIARPKTAVALVLDQSGSMDWDAGDGRKRVEVLREAAQNFVDVIQPENGIAVVRFDHDAYPGMPVVEAGPEVFGAGRAQARALITGHNANPAGATSIGDGIELGANELDLSSGYDHTAMIVLTDGQENTGKFISEVAGSIDDRTFAIGLGRAEDINPEALDAVTAGTGGYVVLTGTLSSDEYFLLSKYYLQILAGVTNQEIVLDPDGHLQPGNSAKVPFVLTEADAGADVLVLSPAPWALRYALETPGGDLIKPAALPAGVNFISANAVAYFRFNLPVVPASGRPGWAGRWTLHLECDAHDFRKYLGRLENDPRAYEYAKRNGLRWSAVVQARSSLKLDARLTQDSIKPGAWMKLGARLSEYGLPIEGRAQVRAELTSPSGATSLIELHEQGGGSFATEFNAPEYGLYRWRVMAAGKTLRGTRFTRERTLTGSIYVVRPPVDPKPPQGGDDDPRPCPERLRALIKVIRADRRIAGLIERGLQPYGVTLGEVVRCVESAMG